MDIVFGIIWGIELDDPVNLRKVKATLGDIRTEENTSLSLTEFKIGRSTLLLFLLTVDVLDRDVHIVEKIGIKLNSIA